MSPTIVKTLKDFFRHCTDKGVFDRYAAEDSPGGPDEVNAMCDAVDALKDNQRQVDPFIVKASDYHEFSSVVSYFRAAGFGQLRFIELGTNGGYAAVFFQDGDREKANPLIEQHEKENPEDKD